MTGTLLRFADLYHVGIIVPDIATAATRLSAVAGYEWTKPVEATLSVATEAGDHEVPTGTATHRLGYWADDLTAAAQQLEDAGFRLEARPSGDTLTSFAYYTDNTGLRIEIVDQTLFPDWRGFLTMMAA